MNETAGVCPGGVPLKTMSYQGNGVFTASMTDRRLGRSSQLGRTRIQTGLEQLQKQSESNEVPFLRVQKERGTKHASSPGLVVGSPRR